MTKPTTREIVGRALTDLFSMTPWPLEFFSMVALWHYGGLFSTTVPFTRDWKSVVSQIMPDDSWGISARVLAVALGFLCLTTWLAHKRFYRLRTTLALVGALDWFILCYSSERAAVPFIIWKWYCFLLVMQLWTAAVIYARRKGSARGIDPIGGGE